jgi:hypothetical protein
MGSGAAAIVLVLSGVACAQRLPTPPGFNPGPPSANVPPPNNGRPPAGAAPANANGNANAGAQPNGAVGGDADDGGDDFGFARMPQVTTGPNGFGIALEIWTQRKTVAPSKLVGRVVVTGEVAATGMLANTEHFFWFDAGAAWNRAAPLYLKQVSTDVRGERAPAGVVSVQRFNNLIGCKTLAKPAPAAGQWRVVTGGANPANLVKDGSTLYGYWKVSTRCAPISPGPDGWMDLSPVSENFLAVSYGTPPAN